ncbi:MAG: D-tyrosyl-tRNA(Tyr) deacylase [candidate division Zixibacteria bacterium]|nr:D-tyrosyl-tRNA(Tyr) deacylase [candidate division Zixibacteria bacterium]
MRAVIQRVRSASVEVDGEIIAKISRGLLILIGAGKGDAEAQAGYLANKISGLRIFEDADGKMNLSLIDIEGEALIVSQFTLYANTRKGKRPSFGEALEPGRAEELYEDFVAKIRAEGLKTETGKFGAKMLVSLENDGPVTIIVESPA